MRSAFRLTVARACYATADALDAAPTSRNLAAEEDPMQHRIIRSLFFAVAAGGVLATPLCAFGQGGDPIRVGFLTVRTGPLAAGGKQMEEGILLFLKERNNT